MTSEKVRKGSVLTSALDRIWTVVRQKKLSFAIGVHTLIALSTAERECADGVACFYSDCGTTIKTLEKEYGGGFPGNFLDTYRAITQVPHQFLFIHRQGPVTYYLHNFKYLLHVG